MYCVLLRMVKHFVDKSPPEHALITFRAMSLYAEIREGGIRRQIGGQHCRDFENSKCECRPGKHAHIKQRSCVFVVMELTTPPFCRRQPGSAHIWSDPRLSWTELVNIDPTSANIGPSFAVSEPKFDRSAPKLVEVGPMLIDLGLADFGPSLVKGGRARPNFGRAGAWNFGPSVVECRSETGRARPMFGKLRPGSDYF